MMDAGQIDIGGIFCRGCQSLGDGGERFTALVALLGFGEQRRKVAISSVLNAVFSRRFKATATAAMTWLLLWLRSGAKSRLRS